MRRLGRRLLQYAESDYDSDSIDYDSGVLSNDSALDAMLGGGAAVSSVPPPPAAATTMSPIELVQSVWSRPSPPPLADELATVLSAADGPWPPPPPPPPVAVSLTPPPL